MQNEPSIRKRINNEQVTRQRKHQILGEVEGFHEMLTLNNVRFSCECDRANCRGIIEMASTTFTSLHRKGNRFIVKPGHEHNDIEKVVDKYYGFLVVEKPAL